VNKSLKCHSVCHKKLSLEDLENNAAVKNTTFDYFMIFYAFFILCEAEILYFIIVAIKRVTSTTLTKAHIY